MKASYPDELASRQASDAAIIADLNLEAFLEFRAVVVVVVEFITVK